MTSRAEAMHFMFNDPFDATRNTGIQYLMMMTLHLGLSRVRLNSRCSSQWQSPSNGRTR